MLLFGAAASRPSTSPPAPRGRLRAGVASSPRVDRERRRSSSRWWRRWPRRRPGRSGCGSEAAAAGARRAARGPSTWGSTVSRAPPRGRRDDADRRVRARPGDVRRRPDPGLTSPTTGSSAATGGTRIRPRRRTTRSSTSPAGRARLRGASEPLWRRPARTAPRVRRVQHLAGGARARFGDLHPRREGPADERLRLPRAASNVPLVRWLGPPRARGS